MTPSRGLAYNQDMTRTLFLLFISVIVCFSGILSGAQENPVAPVDFEYLGSNFRLEVIREGISSQIWLNGPGSRVRISPGNPGENISPVPQQLAGELYVAWVYYGPPENAVAVWRLGDQSLQWIPMPSFRFLSTPRLLEKSDEVSALIFLGNREGCDRLFLFNIGSGSLRPLTPAEGSVKKWSVNEKSDGWTVEAAMLKQRLEIDLLWNRIEEKPEVRSTIPHSSAPRELATLDSCREKNTYVAFGDSITWGEMHMNNLPGEYNPQLAYPEVMKETLLPIYGEAFSINEGVPGDRTIDGIERIDSTLNRIHAAFFLLMMGTNDTIFNGASMDSSLENIEYIVDRALDAGLKVIVSTIPPRKDPMGSFTYVLNNIADLNEGIGELAEEKQEAGADLFFIDTHKAFMDYYPPGGWKLLLEDNGGNHASPLGHQVIAELFSGKLVLFPPEMPGSITVDKNTFTEKRVVWPANCESDFHHYTVEYGFNQKTLNRTLTVTESACTFYTFPFQTQVYFRIRTEDKSGIKSGFTQVIKIEQQ